MPDKLTDSEIKKALECLVTEACPDCDSCSLYDYCCKKRERIDALDLINRKDQENESLKAEVERLKSRNKDLRNTVELLRNSVDTLSGCLETAKAEAYKEFAERFKKKLSQKYTTSLWKVYCEEIDNLLKELVGEPDES